MLPSVVVTFYVLLLMNFIRSLPAEMEEAAMIDGASPMQILIRIILPVMVPCLATITVYTTLATWNEWFQGVIYMNDPSQYPLMSYLRSTVLISNMENLTPQEQERLANIGNKTYQAARLLICQRAHAAGVSLPAKVFHQGSCAGLREGLTKRQENAAQRRIFQIFPILTNAILSSLRRLGGSAREGLRQRSLLPCIFIKLIFLKEVPPYVN